MLPCCLCRRRLRSRSEAGRYPETAGTDYYRTERPRLASDYARAAGDARSHGALRGPCYRGIPRRRTGDAAPYDLVILNYYDKRKPDLRWGDRADAALLDYVKSGKGIVVYHFSVAAFDGWSDFEKMCAGNWRPNQGHHSPKHDFSVKIVDDQHPITRGLKPILPTGKR